MTSHLRTIFVLVTFAASAAHAVVAPKEFELLKETDLACICFANLTDFAISQARYAESREHLAGATRSLAYSTYWFERARIGGESKRDMQFWVDQTSARDSALQSPDQRKYCFDVAKEGFDLLAPATQRSYLNQSASEALEAYGRFRKVVPR